MSDEVHIGEAHAGQRADEALAELLGISVQAAKRLCEQRRVLRGRKALKKGERVASGDVLTVVKPAADTSAPPQVELLYESPRFVVVDKPAGMTSHKLHPEDPPSALEAVALARPQVRLAGPDPREGGLLHRLDVGTSGALAFALEPHAYEDGRAAFTTGTARKLYLALVHGPAPSSSIMDRPIAHHPGDERRMVVVTSENRYRGKPRAARTRIALLMRAGLDALVLVDAEGGRRHQVRVHLADAGIPLWGDDLYGGPVFDADSTLRHHALHALSLRFMASGETVIARAPVPAAFADAAVALLGDGVHDVLARAFADAEGMFPATDAAH